MFALPVLLLSLLGNTNGIALKQTNVLLVAPSDPFFTACDAKYLGAYDSQQPLAIYAVQESCNSFDSLNSGSLVSLEDLAPQSSLTWVEEVVAEGALRESEPDFTQSLASLLTPPPIISGQTTLGMERQPRIEVLWSNQRGAILSIPTEDLGHLDLILPRLWEAVALPVTALPSPYSEESESDKRLGKILSKIHFNPDVASILSSISVAQMSFDIRWLTGEASDSPITSRHSFSEDARVAAQWLKTRFQELGADCSYMEFLEGFTPNVICKYAASPSISRAENTTSPRVILSAHYDSRGTFGSTRQPGGDDDGSGITHLLAVARAIYRRKVRFNVDVELVAFAGEEQGLLGSHAYAKKLYEESADIILMVQADMLAYHSGDEPMQLGLPERIGSPVASELVANISSIYAPELTVGPTAACCSDHQSFWMYGFTSTQVFERAGGIIDPKYHNSGDLSNRTNFDLEQVHSIAKVTLATILHTAGFTLESETL